MRNIYQSLAHQNLLSCTYTLSEHQCGYIWQIILKWTQFSDRLCSFLMKAVTVVNVWKISLKGHTVKHQTWGVTEGMQGPETGGGRQAPVSTVSTQCTEETNTKRKALPPREKGLWVHSQESQDSTPRKGRKKKFPAHSLTFLQGTRASVVQGDLRGPLPLGCAACHRVCPLPSTFLKALDWLP